MECYQVLIRELGQEFKPEYEYVDRTDFISKLKRFFGIKVEKQKVLKFTNMHGSMCRHDLQIPISYHVKCSESGEITSTPIVKYTA